MKLHELLGIREDEVPLFLHAFACHKVARVLLGIELPGSHRPRHAELRAVVDAIAAVGAPLGLEGMRVLCNYLRARHPGYMWPELIRYLIETWDDRETAFARLGPSIEAAVRRDALVARFDDAERELGELLGRAIELVELTHTNVEDSVDTFADFVRASEAA